MPPDVRKALSGIFVAILASFPLAASVPPARAQPAAPAVTVARPLQRQITEWDEHIARLEPSALVELRARVSGQVESLHFRDGQIVRPGDLLFTIDRRPFEIAVQSARAEVTRAEARLLLAEQEVDRTMPLIRDRFAPQAQLDQRRAAQRDALAGLDGARAALRNAELELEWTEVRAPIGGRVSDRRVDPGNLVQQGATLLTTIRTLDPVYASFDMSEADWLRLSRRVRSGERPSDRDGGNAVQLRLADERDWPWRGRMDFVDAALEPRSGTVRARALIANPDLFLTPGTFARLRLWTGEAVALLVPDTAIAADQASRMVLTVGAHGEVVPKPVELGPVVDGLRVIRGGLAPEDRVIIAGLHRARPGSRVTAEPGRIAPADTQVVEAR